VAADEISKIKNGDYLDISLGLPYTTVDNHTYVFSYGAVNKDNQTPIYYQGMIVGYLVPAGNTESYKQSVPQYSGSANPNWNVIDNDNSEELANLGSNGYYQIVFNNALSEYVKRNPGKNKKLTISVNLTWYNPSGNGERSVYKPSEMISLYGNNQSSSKYTPSDDLKIGNQIFSSGISLSVVPKKQGTSEIPVADKIVQNSQTGSIQAHTWMKIGDREYFQIVDPTQSVGISLKNLGRDFTITVTKPASNENVKTSFVSAKDLKKQLQKNIVPVGNNDSSYLSDQIANEDFYLSDQFAYTTPQINVVVSNTGDNQLTYHVTIEGDYEGFRTTSKDETSAITLITWKPTDQVALMPGKGINNFNEDYQKVSYHNNKWLNGYQIQSKAVFDYMNSHPWHVTVRSQGNSKPEYDLDYVYWIGASTNAKPTNKAYVDLTYYGFVNQTIHYVDVNGNQMLGNDGKPIPDTPRLVTFTSDTGEEGSFKTDSYFSDTNIPPVKDYSTYRGQKSTDGKKITYSGEKITKIGDEGKFTYPHSDFIEYVVYVKNSDPKPTPQPETVKDSRTVTETIHYVYQDGTKAANDETQQITFTRTGSKTSNSTTWNDWIPAEGTFNEVVSPEIQDYTPNIKTVNEIKIAPEDNNIEKTVIYTKNSTPTPGTKPTPTPQPEPKPTPTPEPQPTSTPTPAPQPVPASEPQPQLTPKSAPQPGTSNPSSKSDTLVEPQPESQLVQTENRQLPQTGSEQAKGLMALGIASLLTNFGLGMKKKKNI
jgi:LPXTG-motif cell wall-anchored protein